MNSLGPCTGTPARSRRTRGDRCISTRDKPERCTRPPHPGLPHARAPKCTNAETNLMNLLPQNHTNPLVFNDFVANFLRLEEVCTGCACCRLSQRIKPGSRILRPLEHKGGMERWVTTIASGSVQRLIPLRFLRDTGSHAPLGSNLSSSSHPYESASSDRFPLTRMQCRKCKTITASRPCGRACQVGVCGHFRKYFRTAY